MSFHPSSAIGNHEPTLAEMMAACRSEAYMAAFEENGWDDPAFLFTLGKRELENVLSECGMKPGHASKFLCLFELFKAERQTQQSTLLAKRTSTKRTSIERTMELTNAPLSPREWQWNNFTRWNGSGMASIPDNPTQDVAKEFLRLIKAQIPTVDAAFDFMETMCKSEAPTDLRRALFCAMAYVVGASANACARQESWARVTENAATDALRACATAAQYDAEKSSSDGLLALRWRSRTLLVPSIFMAAHSGYFASLIAPHNSGYSAESAVQLPDELIDDEASFRALAEFLYTGDPTPALEVAPQQAWRFGHHYHIEQLFHAASKYLVDKAVLLDPRASIALLREARLLGDSRVAQFALPHLDPSQLSERGCALLEDGLCELAGYDPAMAADLRGRVRRMYATPVLAGLSEQMATRRVRCRVDPALKMSPEEVHILRDSLNQQAEALERAEQEAAAAAQLDKGLAAHGHPYEVSPGQELLLQRKRERLVSQRICLQAILDNYGLSTL